MSRQPSFEDQVAEVDALSREIHDADKRIEELKWTLACVRRQRAKAIRRLGYLNDKLDRQYSPVPPVELGYVLTESEIASAKVRGIDLQPYVEAGLLPD